jgi:hypothetical protein
MKTLLVTLFLMIPVVAAFPQTSLATETDIRDFEEAFLEDFLAERFQEAFDRFRGDQSGIPLSEVDTLEVGTARQLTSLRNRYGPGIDFVFLGSESIEDVIIQHLYLVRYRNHALRVRFVYYDNGTFRRLNYFSWDDSVDALFSW